MRYFIGLMLLAVITFSCGSKEDQVKASKDKVMEIHDQVMPEMGNLRKIQKALVEKSNSVDSTESAKLKTLAANISDANESMMNWMHSFDPNFQGTNEEILAYFEKQKESIAEVQKSMLDALSEGQKALNE